MQSLAVFDAPPFMKGWLFKKGEVNVAWKKRFFVLKDDTLSYYERPRDVQPKGQLSLMNANLSYGDDKLTSKHGFMISVPDSDRIYTIHASFEEEMREWLEAIQRAIEWSNRMHGVKDTKPGKSNKSSKVVQTTVAPKSTLDLYNPKSYYTNPELTPSQLSYSSSQLFLQQCGLSPSLSQWRSPHSLMSSSLVFNPLVNTTVLGKSDLRDVVSVCAHNRLDAMVMGGGAQDPLIQVISFDDNTNSSKKSSTNTRTPFQGFTDDDLHHNQKNSNSSSSSSTRDDNLYTSNTFGTFINNKHSNNNSTYEIFSSYTNKSPTLRQETSFEVPPNDVDQDRVRDPEYFLERPTFYKHYENTTVNTRCVSWVDDVLLVGTNTDHIHMFNYGSTSSTVSETTSNGSNNGSSNGSSNGSGSSNSSFLTRSSSVPLTPTDSSGSGSTPGFSKRGSVFGYRAGANRPSIFQKPNSKSSSQRLASLSLEPETTLTLTQPYWSKAQLYPAPGDWSTLTLSHLAINPYYSSSFLSISHSNLSLWDLTAEKQLQCTENTSSAPVSAVTWVLNDAANCSNLVAVGNMRGSLKVIDTRVLSSNANECVVYNVNNAHQQALTDIAWSPLMPHWFATASTDHSLSIWDQRFNKHAVMSFGGTMTSAANSIAWSSSHYDMLTTGHVNGEVSVWNLRTSPHCAVYTDKSFDSHVVKVAYSHQDPNIVVAADARGGVKTFNTTPAFVDKHVWGDQLPGKWDLDVSATYAQLVDEYRSKNEHKTNNNTSSTSNTAGTSNNSSSNTVKSSSNGTTTTTTTTTTTITTSTSSSSSKTTSTTADTVFGQQSVSSLTSFIEENDISESEILSLLQDEDDAWMYPHSISDQHSSTQSTQCGLQDNLHSPFIPTHAERLLFRLMYVRDWDAVFAATCQLSEALWERGLLLRVSCLLNRVTNHDNSSLLDLQYWTPLFMQGIRSKQQQLLQQQLQQQQFPLKQHMRVSGLSDEETRIATRTLPRMMSSTTIAMNNTMLATNSSTITTKVLVDNSDEQQRQLVKDAFLYVCDQLCRAAPPNNALLLTTPHTRWSRRMQFIKLRLALQNLVKRGQWMQVVNLSEDMCSHLSLRDTDAGDEDNNDDGDKSSTSGSSSGSYPPGLFKQSSTLFSFASLKDKDKDKDKEDGEFEGTGKDDKQKFGLYTQPILNSAMLLKAVLCVLAHDHLRALHLALQVGSTLRSTGNFALFSRVALALCSPTVYYLNNNTNGYGAVKIHQPSRSAVKRISELGGSSGLIKSVSSETVDSSQKRKILSPYSLESDSDNDDDDNVHSTTNTNTNSKNLGSLLSSAPGQSLHTLNNTTPNPAATTATTTTEENKDVWDPVLEREKELTNIVNKIKHKQSMGITSGSSEKIHVNPELKLKAQTSFERDLKNPKIVIEQLQLLYEVLTIVETDLRTGGVYHDDDEVKLSRYLPHGDEMPLWNPYRVLSLYSQQQAPDFDEDDITNLSIPDNISRDDVLLCLRHPRKMLTMPLPPISSSAARKLSKTVEQYREKSEMLTALTHRLYIHSLLTRDVYDRAMFVTTWLTVRYQGLPFAKSLQQTLVKQIAPQTVDFLTGLCGKDIGVGDCDNLSVAACSLTNMLFTSAYVPPLLEQNITQLFKRIVGGLNEKLNNIATDSRYTPVDAGKKKDKERNSSDLKKAKYAEAVSKAESINEKLKKITGNKTANSAKYMPHVAPLMKMLQDVISQYS